MARAGRRTARTGRLYQSRRAEVSQCRIQYDLQCSSQAANLAPERICGRLEQSTTGSPDTDVATEKVDAYDPAVSKQSSYTPQEK